MAAPTPLPLDPDPRIHTSLEHLRGLEGRARTLSFLPKQPSNSVLNGRHASRLRGRGLNFEELRGYVPGDDTRTIDWKVTARTGVPHVRVYTEERDRPALLVVDQRMSMFFGSVLNMKSVTAAEAAALIAFRVLDQGDRIGGLVFGDSKIAEIRPKRSAMARDRLIASISAANMALNASVPEAETPLPLNSVLTMIARIATRDHLVVVLSDFDGIDARTPKLIDGISRRNDLVLVPVLDPLARDVPNVGPMIISDGSLQAELDTDRAETRKGLQDLHAERLGALRDWERRFGVPVLPLSTDEDTVTQLRALMGLGRPRR